MKKLLPIILILLGAVGGGAAGMFLKPAPEPKDEEHAEGKGDGEHKGEDQDELAADLPPDGEHGATPEGERDYVKIGRQIIIPVVQDGETQALMLFELAVDVPLGQRASVVDREPRLRDAFLRELFEMSYTGAFMTTFTDDRVIEELRRNLVAAARAHLGDIVSDVLILDVMRQELG